MKDIEFTEKIRHTGEVLVKKGKRKFCDRKTVQVGSLKKSRVKVMTVDICENGGGEYSMDREQRERCPY